MRLLFYRFFCCEIKSLSVRRLFPEIAFLFLIAWNGEARIFTYRKKLLLSVLPPRYFFPSPNMYQPKVFFFFFVNLQNMGSISSFSSLYFLGHKLDFVKVLSYHGDIH